MGYTHDPVSALAETEATGEIAALFADIRKTMQLPLVTSIWRTLAGVDGGLRAVWAVTKPLYETGQPAAALVRLREQATLPVPEPLAPEEHARAGVSPGDLPVIRAIIAAYNRSNGMNLIGLTGLVVPPSGTPPKAPAPPAPSSWPALPSLPSQADVAADTWARLQEINRFGAVPGEPGLATVWRHLAHWPGLLSVIHAALSPLQRDGTIQRSIQQVLDIAHDEGARLAHLRPQTVSMPETARAMITNYVLNPGLVARMVAIGHGLARWLELGNGQLDVADGGIGVWGVAKGKEEEREKGSEGGEGKRKRKSRP